MDFDVVVIGSGAGGGVAAFKLAEAGKRVLLLERGKRFSDSDVYQNEQRMLIDMVAFDDRILKVNGIDRRLYIGGVLGGGTSLYGAALIRPNRDDFTPGKHYAQFLPRYLWEWPLNYDDLEPFYDEAEQLFHVAGPKNTSERNIAFPSGGYRWDVPTLEPINQKIATALEAFGYHPQHLPLAIDFDRCERCSNCPGYICPNESRSSTINRLLDRAESEFGMTIKILSEAIQFVKNGKGEITGIQIRSRENNQQEIIRANRYIVAAGAIGSTAILMKSDLKDDSGQLGRNYMYHAGGAVVGVYPTPTDGANRFIKQLGFDDLYFGTRDFPHKMGYAQTLPVPGPLSIRKESGYPLPASWAKVLLNHLFMFSGFVEDLPQADNRIMINGTGQIRLHHKYHEYDIYRSKYYLQIIRKVLKKAGAVFTIGATADRDSTHTAHQVGTARFGRNPRTSVLDSDCRLHWNENVFVADGSFMPTSLGVGPALTIMANAMRIADIVKEEI